jgi:hypothetical protein
MIENRVVDGSKQTGAGRLKGFARSTNVADIRLVRDDYQQDAVDVRGNGLSYL